MKACCHGKYSLWAAHLPFMQCLVPFAPLQVLEDTIFSFGTSLTHTCAPVSEVRNWLLFQTAFTGTHADLLLSFRGLRKTYLLPFWAFTPWRSVAGTFLVGEVETGSLKILCHQQENTWKMHSYGGAENRVTSL